jgi:hypothetical protein
VAARRRVPAAVFALLAVLVLVPIAAAVGAHVLGSPSKHAAAAPTSATLAPPSASEVATASLEDQPGLHGRILDGNGDAVVGASVRALSPAAPWTVYAETTSDATGAFLVPPLGVDRLTIEADAPLSGAVHSDVLSGVADHVTLVLAPAGIAGAVVDSQGHSVAGATIRAEGAPWAVATATSDEGGGFRLPLVPFEASGLVAVASGYRTARAALPPRADGAEVRVQITLQSAPPLDGDVEDPDGKPVKARVVACEGQPNEARATSGDDGVFQLPPSAIGCDVVALHDTFAPSDVARAVEGARLRLRLGSGGSIEGVVVDERGMRVPQFSIGIESFVGPHGTSARPVAPRPFDSGVFHLEGLAPGSYVLTALAEGKSPTRSEPVEVRASSTTRARIAFVAGGVVVGHVTDDQHVPLAGVRLDFDAVSLIGASPASATTDASGAFRIDGAPAGLFTLRAQKEGYRVRMLSGLRVESGRTLTQDVVMSWNDGGASFEFGGIGATLVAGGDGIAFQVVYPGDPADRAGIHSGDRIVRIDGDDAAGMSVADVLQRLRGEIGSSVGITVRRRDSTDVDDVVVVRGRIAH